MAPCRIVVSGAGRLTQLCSYPNAPGSTESLADTVVQWDALTAIVPKITAGDKWDPSPDPPSPT